MERGGVGDVGEHLVGGTVNLGAGRGHHRLQGW
jgi:hypothetical protein